PAAPDAREPSDARAARDRAGPHGARRSGAARMGARGRDQERDRRTLGTRRADRRGGGFGRPHRAAERPRRRSRGAPRGAGAAVPPNPAQDAAVRHPGGPLLVLAGAGSGKTRVLTARIAHLLRERGVAPSRIFAVTFTNKAAGEMRARVAALLGADPRGLWIGTFHSLSARLLRREAPHLGFGPNFTIYDQDDSEALVKRLLDQRGHSPKA